MKHLCTILVCLVWATVARSQIVPQATLVKDRELAMDWGKLIVNSIAVSPDRASIAVVAGADEKAKPVGRIVVFDFKTGKVLTQIETENALLQVVWGIDGSLITRDQAVRFWDLKAKKVTRTIEEKEMGGPLRAMAITADGKVLAVAARSATPVMTWRLPDGRGAALWQEKAPVEVASLSFDAKGDRLAVGGYQGNLGRVIDMGTAKIIKELNEPGVSLMQDVIMSRDGLCVAACTPGARQDVDRLAGMIFNVRTGRICSDLSSTAQSVRPLALSPDGNTLIASDGRGGEFHGGPHLLGYTMYGGLLYVDCDTDGPIGSAAFVDDGTVVAASTHPRGVSHVCVYGLTINPGPFKARFGGFRSRWIRNTQ